jgi:hypothetical protein
MRNKRKMDNHKISKVKVGIKMEKMLKNRNRAMKINQKVVINNQVRKHKMKLSNNNPDSF